VQKSLSSPDLHIKERGRRKEFFQGDMSDFFQSWANSDEISFHQLETERHIFVLKS